MPIYVHHSALGKVDDVFNAESIWQAPGLQLFSRRPLLRDLLERAPRELRGRAPRRCFSHITLMLPQDEIDEDRHLTRGARLRELAQSLQALHQKDFGDQLGSEDVRYHVVGAEALEPGEVEVKFGHAVYLPGPSEQVMYTVSASRDNAVWKQVCAIYPKQRLVLLGLDTRDATHTVPDWPFGPDCALLLVNDGPDTPIEVQARPKEAFECSYDAAAGCYVLRPRGSSSGARVLFKVERSGAPKQAARPIEVPRTQPAKAPAVWKRRTPEAEDAQATALPARASVVPPAPEGDATYAPVAARQRVRLAALALPRLSRYRDTGATALEIGLDRSLAPAAAAEQSLIRFAVTDRDEVHAITAAGRQRVTLPARITPTDAGALQLLEAPPEMADRYCGLLRLPNAPEQAIAGGARFVFGRNAPMLSALRVLDKQDCLRRAPGLEAASADRLGLSRNAFSFEAVDDGYRIGRLSPTQALYHLDEEMRFVAQVGDADEAYHLPPGHHLVAGHYVLRFEA
ncbi:hypothetical protein GCM10027321_41480 [Massilia terrae]|uniref:Uncharacterized protein n=1 Tax=Massilia terrae TaxID=1811224 RepID=A0ABT2CUK6_9BURK|nr:hypothetical protein [Massilia terrae]MCS0657660.1 hypothetical protein [Massilia terrae]